MDEASGSPILITELPEGQRRKRLAYRLYLCAQALLAMEREQSRGFSRRRDCADETRIPFKAKSPGSSPGNATKINILKTNAESPRFAFFCSGGTFVVGALRYRSSGTETVPLRHLVVLPEMGSPRSETADSPPLFG
jgi:hypothetical protein